MTNTPPKADAAPDLAVLAAEACDLWQAQLEACAQDPQLRGELLKMAEPSQRLFAGWAAMMQAGLHANAASPSPNSQTTPAATAAASAPAAPTQTGPAPAQPASDGSALRLAQLALRVSELEKRVARLEATQPNTWPNAGPDTAATTRRKA